MFKKKKISDIRNLRYRTLERKTVCFETDNYVIKTNNVENLGQVQGTYFSRYISMRYLHTIYKIGTYFRWLFSIGAHVRSDLCYFIYLRHLFRSKAATNLISYSSEKTYFPIHVRDDS